MKNSISLTAVAAAAMLLSLSACTKAEKPSSDDLQPVQKHSLTVSVGDPATKATGITDANEKNVKTLDIVVFDADSTLECYSRVTGAKSTTISVSTGTKYIYALVNWPSALSSSVDEESDLKAIQAKLTDDDKDNLHMTGYVTKDITADGTINIDVYRKVSRIDIKKITTAFTSPALAAANFYVDSIYVINAVGSYPVDDSCWSDKSSWGSKVDWYNKEGFVTSGADDMLLDAGVALTFSGNTSKTMSYSYYVYPNAVTAANDHNNGTWQPRCTRLVISARIADGSSTRRVYYPITIPVDTANKIWSVDELKITRAGSSSPDQPVVTQSCTFTINVKDWAGTVNLNPSI